FAPQYGTDGLDAESMAEVRATLRMMLDAHDPYPAIALDAAYGIVANNTAFGKLLAELGLEATEGLNLVDLVFAPGPMREAVVNWPEVATYMAHRMRESLRVRGSRSPLRPALKWALQQPGVADAVAASGPPGGRPVVPVTLVV